MASVQPVTQGYQYYPPIKSVKEFPDHYEYTFKEEASTGKKWGVGLGSFFIPGLGQGINGQWGKAAGFFGGLVASVVVPGFLLVSKAAGGNLEKSLSSYPAMNMVSFLTGLGVRIWAAYDAVKNSGSEYKQSFPKEQVLNAQA